MASVDFEASKDFHHAARAVEEFLPHFVLYR
jgi:hypothetical protein